MRMRKHSTSLVLVATTAGLGLMLTTPFAGCGGGKDTTGSSSSGTGGGGGAPRICGDGILDQAEECDDGNTIQGDGCQNDCSFTCTKGTAKGDAACDDMEPCNGAEICTDQHTCKPGTASADGTTCGTGKICKAGVCSDDLCGDGFTSAMEECDDGNATGGDGCENTCKFTCKSADPAACTPADPCQGKGTCDDTTHTCAPGVPLPDGAGCGAGGVCVMGACKLASCSNGMLDPGEQCDDGNTTNLDGCDATCKFEQDHRVNWLQMQFAPEAYCAMNALGGAVAGVAQGQLQMSLDTGVADGSISVMFKMLGLDDLTGTTDPKLELGSLNGTPAMGAMYTGTNDLDWWYKVDPTSIDANRNPLATLSGSIAAKVLNAGPGNFALTIVFAGSPGVLKMSNAKVQTTIGATSAPLASAGATPGHLATEHLDPALVSFATTGQQTANEAGKLCGNVSAASLAKIPIPAALAQGGGTACSQNYTMTNTLLDLFVGGCTVLGIIQAINPTQPDQVDPTVPAGGAGGPYKLTANAQKVVSGCTDKNNQAAPLATCLDAAAYSSYFKFTTDRVIVK